MIPDNFEVPKEKNLGPLKSLMGVGWTHSFDIVVKNSKTLHISEFNFGGTDFGMKLYSYFITYYISSLF